MKGKWQQEQSSVRPPPLETVARRGGHPLNNYGAFGSAEKAAARQAEAAAAETSKPSRTNAGTSTVGCTSESRWDKGNDEVFPPRDIVYRSGNVEGVRVSGGGGGGGSTDRLPITKAKPPAAGAGPPSRRWTTVDPAPVKPIPSGASSATAVGASAATTATTITGTTGSTRGVVYPIEGLGPAKEIRRPRPSPAIAGPQPWAGQGMKKSSASGAAEAVARELRGVSNHSHTASAGRVPKGGVEEQERSAADTAALKEAQAKEKENALILQISEMYELLARVRDEQEAVDGTGYGSPDRQRIILVSRRLPYKLQMTTSGSWKAEINNADQALQNFRVVHDKMECLWVGWPGTDVEPGRQNSLMEQLKEYRLVPIFLDPPMEDKFYEGFCKTILWPLFHSSMPTTEDTIASHDVDSVDKQREEGQLWMAYKSVNQSFADAVQDVYRDGDLIWVHDYHLTMVPQMLRNVLPSAKIGFFLHLPFPSSEIYRILPYREAILEGVLSSDLVGFQTYDYARHFLSTVESLLDANCSPQGIEHNGHFANVAICPVGIDPEAVVRLCNTPQVTSLMRRWAKQTRGKTMLLGVDSLDATKGLVHKFLALEEMFGMEPALADRVNFVQVCFTGAQSRERKVLEGQLQMFVARINSKLGSIDEAGPVQYFLDINLHELSALYSIADVLVITPIRDGMNIVPFEYVVSRECRQLPATVVLSEFAGCARSLGGAVLINPWNTTELTQQMIGAINMEEDEREIRHRNMSSYVNNFTATLWCTRFIAQLREANEGPERTTARLLQKEHVIMSFMYSRWRLLVFNLEGVLARHCALPELVHVSAEAVATLDALSKESKNMVVVKSPRSRETLSRLLGHTNCVLAAEHGAFIRWGKHAQWQSLLPNPDMSWTSDIEPLLEYYTERTPGAVKETRELSRAWHYRDCDLGHGAWQAKQLHVSLIQLSKRLPIHVYAGDKVLEIIPQPLMLQVSHFLEIVVLRFRRLLNSKPVDYIPRNLYGSEEEEDQEQFSSVIAGADVRDFEGYHSGTNSGGAGSTQDCDNATKTLKIFDGDHHHQQHQHQHQHQSALRLPPLDITAFPVPDDGGSKGSRGRQRASKSTSGAKGNRARSASYGGTGSAPSEGRQRNRHRRSLSRDGLLSRSRSSSLSRISMLHPRPPPEGIFTLDVAGLGEWETVKGLGPGVKSPGGWSPRTADTTSTDAEEASDEEKDADIEFVLVIAGGHDLNDENMFEAMTPPEYNLEDFMDGMEALDNPDEAKVDGERSAPAWTGVSTGGGVILGKTSPKVSNVSSAGFCGGVGGVGTEVGAGITPLESLEPHPTGKKMPAPTIASMGIMGSAMKGNAQTITSLGGTVPTPTPPSRRDGVSGTGEMTASKDTSGNWEDHPTVPPPPMGSPQVRLDSRVLATSLLYASSSASTVTPDEIDAAEEEGGKGIGEGDLATEEEQEGGGGERNGHRRAVKDDGAEVDTISVSSALCPDDRRQRNEEGVSSAANEGVPGWNGSSNSQVAKLNKLTLEKTNNGTGTTAASHRPPPSPSAVALAVIATGAMGRRGSSAASNKGRGRRETIPNSLFAELRVRSRSRSPSTGRVDGRGGSISSTATAAASAAAASSTGNPDALLLLNDLHPDRRSRTPTPPPPTLRGGVHEALAEANAAAVAAGELPPPAESVSHQQQLLLQRSTRAHHRESDPPPPPSPPPPSLRRGSSVPALSSMEMLLAPTGSVQEERQEEEDGERKSGAGSSSEGISMAYFGGIGGGRSMMSVGVREGRSSRDVARDTIDPSPGFSGVESSAAGSGGGGGGGGEAPDMVVSSSSGRSGGMKSVGLTGGGGGGGGGGVSRPSVVGRPGTTLSPVPAPALTTSVSTTALAEQPVLQLGRGSSASSGGGSGNGGGGGSGLGGLVPKKDRRLDISGQNRFIPRKDYPPSSILYQAMRTTYGNDFGSRDLPDTPAACWALVASAQDSRRGARKLSASSTGLGQEHGSFDSESTKGPQSPSSSSGAGLTPHKHSSSKLREKNGFSSGGSITRTKSGNGGKLTRSISVGGFSSYYGGGTLEVLRHEIASRQLADASATATATAAAEAEANLTTTTTGGGATNAAVDISTTGEGGVISARSSVARQGRDEASAIKEGIEEEEEEEFRSSGQGLQNLGRRSSVVPEAVEPVDVTGVGVDGMPSQEGVAIVGLKVESSAGVTVDGDERRDALVEEAEEDRFAGGERRGGYGGGTWGQAGEPVRWAEHASSTERPSRDARARDAHYQEQRAPNRSRSQSMNEVGGHGLDLPINTFSCTVGLKLSQANYYIKSSAAAAALCKELSRIKDKEDYTSSVEDYEDGTSVVGGSQPVQYAVSNPNTLGTPHTASTSNLADLAIVMGSQFPDDTPGGFAANPRSSSLGLPGNDRFPYHGRSSAGVAAGMGYNQNSAGWATLAHSIQQSHGLPGAAGLDIESTADTGWLPRSVSRPGGRMGRARSAGAAEDLSFHG